jgi:hypothetical protein
MHNVRRCQIRKALRISSANRTTRYGREHNFDRVKTWHDFTLLPITDTSDYQTAVEQIVSGEQHVLTTDPVEILQPTSGTSSTPKLIPHTKSSAKEFQSALDAWIVDLFIQRPRLFLGPQYWSISPATDPAIEHGSKVPVGFLDDADYFGRRRRWIMKSIMAVPSDVRHITDVEANQYVTLLFLLRAKPLRLVSVWHPSFLTILLNAMRSAWPRLLDDLRNGGVRADINIPGEIRPCLEKQLAPVPARAAELSRLDIVSPRFCRDIWPNLQIISCWRDGNVQSEMPELETAFPDVLIQAKGLLATEGVVSIPFGPAQRHVCALTSHVLEFQAHDGVVFPLWDLQPGQSYRVILTTGAGLYRYQLKDRVEVTAFCGQVPCVRFLGRAGVVSDCVGEKLHIEHVDSIIRGITGRYFREPRFAMLVPSTDTKGRRYNFLVEDRDDPHPDVQAAASSLESELCGNYHYAHARKVGQLQPVAVTLVGPDAQERYRTLMISKGAVAGTIKFPSLCTAPGIERHLTGV